MKWRIFWVIFITVVSIAKNDCWSQIIEELYVPDEVIIQPQKSFLNLSLYAKIDENEKTLFLVNAILFSLVDSVKINHLEFESPSFVKQSLSNEFKPYYISTGQTKSQGYNFIISEHESFTLKGIVYGEINNGKTKVSTLKTLFFFWDEDHYIISDDITQIIGQKRRDGKIITIDDLKIFNREEIE
jgi:hypothetical protein